MITAHVYKDLAQVKSKIIFNLTKRQLICFSLGALIGVPIFFLTRPFIGSSAATLLMMAVMLPAFLLAMYEHHGQPLEKFAAHIIQSCFVRPRQRPYRTNNFYAALERQRSVESEVMSIAQGQSTACKREKTPA